MNRMLILVAGLAVLAGPAAARDIAIPIIGRDDEAVKRDLRKAAQEVCREAAYSNIMAVMTEHNCIKRVVAKGETDLAQARFVNAQAAANARYAAAK